jgi:hypothetical protein
MATLALKPVLPIRSRPFSSKRDQHKHRVRDVWQSGSWQTVCVTAGAIALTFLSVSAPMIDDPAARLFALDTTAAIPMEESFVRDAWSALAFELTPTMLGPAITADMLALAEEDAWPEDNLSVMTMPELEVHALPVPETGGPTPPG